MSSPIIPVTSVQASAKVVPDTAPSTHSTTAANKTHAIRPPADTLQLSTASRVVSLSAIGRSVDQIAAILGISPSEVDTDLGLTATTATSRSSLTTAVTAKQ